MQLVFTGAVSWSPDASWVLLLLLCLECCFYFQATQNSNMEVKEGGDSEEW